MARIREPVWMFCYNARVLSESEHPGVASEYPEAPLGEKGTKTDRHKEFDILHWQTLKDKPQWFKVFIRK